MPDRVPFLDALRGAAAFSVAMAHVVAMPSPPLPAPVAESTLVYVDSMGVCIFFSVSTYSLFHTMPKRLKQPRPMLGFYMRRFFRIAPLFYTWLAIRLLHDRLVGAPAHDVREIAANVAFVFNLFPAYLESLVYAGWTVGVEELFYAVFPLIFRLVRGIPSSIAFFVMALVVGIQFRTMIAATSLAPDLVTRVFTWSFAVHLQTFAAGSVAYFLARHRPAFLDRHPKQAGRVIVGAGAVLTASFSAWPAAFPIWVPWQPLTCLLLIVGLELRPVTWIVNPISRYLGRISYSFYLCHPIVIAYLTPTYRRVYETLPGTFPPLFVCLALTCAVVIPIAETTYRFVEVRGIEAGRRLYEKWGRRPEVENWVPVVP